MLSKTKNLIKKFKKVIIGFFVGGVVLAAGLSGVPQDFYNNLNVKVYMVCNQQEVRRTSIANDLTTFKSRNPDNSLRELNAKERASLKSCEFAKRGNEFAGIYDSAQYGTRIEIIGEVKAIEINGQHGIELFARAWKSGKPLGFGKDGSVEIERFRIFNPPILVDDPNGTIIREWTDEITGELKQRKLREDLLEATRESMAHTVLITGKENAPIVVGKIGNTTSTFRPDYDPESTSVDGYISRESAAETWANAHGALSGTSASDTSTILIANSGFTGSGFFIRRSATGFDTSALGTDIVDSATTSLFAININNYDNDGNDYIVPVKGVSLASNTAVATGDYDTIGAVSNPTGIANSIDIGNLVNSTFANWALTDLTVINPTGITLIGWREGHDAVNDAPTASEGTSGFAPYAADQAGTTNDPKLVVVHSVAAATGEEFIIMFE